MSGVTVPAAECRTEWHRRRSAHARSSLACADGRSAKDTTGAPSTVSQGTKAVCACFVARAAWSSSSSDRVPCAHSTSCATCFCIWFPPPAHHTIHTRKERERGVTCRPAASVCALRAKRAQDEAIGRSQPIISAEYDQISNHKCSLWPASTSRQVYQQPTSWHTDPTRQRAGAGTA